MKIIRRIIVAIFIIFLIYFVYIFFHLDISEHPKKSDVIIVLEGGLDDRARKSVELLDDGYSNSDKIIVTPREVTQNVDTANWYFEAGASEDQLIFEYDATSTWTNAVNSLEIMNEENYTSAVVVSTNFHIRRARLAFERLNKEKDYNFTFTYVASDPVKDSHIIGVRSFSEKFKMDFAETLKYFGYKLELYRWIDV